MDSENKKNLQNDAWRLHQLDKALTNPKHPYCHFSTGNLDTLKHIPESKGIDVRKAFMDFHERYYSANRMKLVVLGRESLDTLEQWVADLFSEITNKGIPQNRWEDEQPFRQEELLTQYFAKPVMESRILSLYFPINDEEYLFESQPSRYLSHLIGHEGPGSIMSYIKSKGWANGLSAGAYPIGPGSQGLFTCEMRLTEDGLKNYQEIIKVFFQYISLLQQTPPQQWIYDEQKNLAEVEFRFRQKTPASKFTSKISAVMQRPLPREWLLSGSSITRKFDPEAIQHCLSYLRPDNFRMSVVSQTFPGAWDQKEKWYGTEYSYSKIPSEFIAEINAAATSHVGERLSELHLPHKNEFIPQNLHVEKKDVKEPARYPRLIRNDDLMRAWYKKDDQFWVPKANVYILLKHPVVGATASNMLKAILYAELVRDALEEYAYDAELAGLMFSVGGSYDGIEIQVSGYNDKLSVLLEKVLVTMRDLDIKMDRYEITKDRLVRGQRNYEFQPPYNQVGDFTRWLNNERGFVNEQMVVELEPLTRDDVAAFFPGLLKQLKIETLVHGNVSKADARAINDLVEATLRPRPLPPATIPVLRSLVLPEGADFRFERTLRDEKNVNHCIEYFLSVGLISDRPLRAKVLLLDQMLHEPAFDTLRTKEQLGYVVFSGYRRFHTSMGFRFIIQSERTPSYLEERIEAFLRSYRDRLVAMTDAEFDGHKGSLRTRLLEKVKNLGMESARFWQGVEGEMYDFESAWLTADCVTTISKGEMVDLFDAKIHPDAEKRAKLAVHLVAKGVSPSGGSTPAAAAESATSAVAAVEKLVDGVKELVVGGVGEEKETAGEVKKGKTIIIKDVREYKARLAVTPAASPVRPFGEFEDLDAKL